MAEGAQKPAAGPKRGWLRSLSTRLHLEDGRFSDEDVQQTLQAVESGVRVGDLCSAQEIAVETYYRWKVRYGGLTLAELSRRRRRDRGTRRAVFALVGVVVLALGYEAFTYILDRASQPAPAAASVAVPAKKARPAPVRGVAPAARQQQASQAAVPPAQKAPAVTPAANTPPTGQTPTPPPARATAAASPQKPPSAVAAGHAPPVAKPAPLRVAAAAQTAPAPAPPVKLAPTNTAAGSADVMATDPPGFSVQVTAVSNAQDARKAVGRLTAAGYFAYITRTSAGQGEMFRVRVGPFEVREQAEDAANRLKSAGYDGVWIAR